MILVDLTSEARGAVFAAIAAAAPAGWQVFDTVPEGTQPPFVRSASSRRRMKGARASNTNT